MKAKKYLINLIIYILLINLILPYTTFATEYHEQVLGEENVSTDEENVDDVANSLVIYAPSALLIEKETGDVLYEKNAYEIMYPASTVKMMTAILTLENCNLNDIITISATAISSVPYGYTLSGIQAGESLTVEDVLYAMLIPSGNDAANVLAEYVGGTTENFVEMMNSKAIEIGCTNTSFTNPSGIHDENMYTTAYDLALIARYAMNIDEFRTIVSTATYTLPATDVYPNSDRVLTNSNHLINPDSIHYYEYAIGIKTGYTNAAQNCLVAGAKKDDTEFIVVILGSTELNTGTQSKFNDAQTLFEFGFTYYNNYYQLQLEENNNLLSALLNLETIIDTESLVNEKNSIQWDYIAYVIAKNCLIIIVVIWILRRLYRKYKRYKYNCKHAKFKYKF